MNPCLPTPLSLGTGTTASKRFSSSLYSASFLVGLCKCKGVGELEVCKVILRNCPLCSCPTLWSKCCEPVKHSLFSSCWVFHLMSGVVNSAFGQHIIFTLDKVGLHFWDTYSAGLSFTRGGEHAEQWFHISSVDGGVDLLTGTLMPDLELFQLIGMSSATLWNAAISSVLQLCMDLAKSKLTRSSMRDYEWRPSILFGKADSDSDTYMSINWHIWIFFVFF